MIKKDVTFYSDSVRLVGDIYIPDEYNAGEKRSAIIMLHGFWGTKDSTLADQFGEYGNKLIKDGYIIFRYDHHGFGKSGGEKGQLAPKRQVKGIKDAITYLQQQPEINPDKIGLLGASFGGGNAVYAAAVDPRVNCVVAIGSVADGEAFLRYERRGWEWQQFLKKLEEDRIRRVLTGKSELVDPYQEMMILSPDEENRHVAEIRFKDAGVDKISLYSGECIMNFKPIDIADKINSPVLIIHAERDSLVPPDKALEMYSRVKATKKLVTFDCGHYDIFMPGPKLELCIDITREWYLANMPPLT